MLALDFIVFMCGRLEAVDDFQQVRAIGHDQDVDGQREASEEGEE